MTTQRNNITVHKSDLFGRNFQYSSFVKFDNNLSFNRLINSALDYKEALLSIDRNDDEITTILEHLLNPTDWIKSNQAVLELSELEKEAVFSKKKIIISLLGLCLLIILASIAYVSSIQFISNNDLKIVLITGVSLMVLGCLFRFFHCLKPKMTLTKAKSAFIKDSRKFIKEHGNFIDILCETLIKPEVQGLDYVEVVTFLTEITKNDKIYAKEILDTFKIYLSRKDYQEKCYEEILNSLPLVYSNYHKSNRNKATQELIEILNQLFSNLDSSKSNIAYEKATIEEILWGVSIVVEKIRCNSSQIDKHQLEEIINELIKNTKRIRTYPDLFEKEILTICELTDYKSDILNLPVFIDKLLPVILSIQDSTIIGNDQFYNFLINVYKKYSDRNMIVFTKILAKVVKTRSLSSSTLVHIDYVGIKLLKNAGIKSPETIPDIFPVLYEMSRNQSFRCSTIYSCLDAIKTTHQQAYMSAKDRYEMLCSSNGLSQHRIFATEDKSNGTNDQYEIMSSILSTKKQI